MSRIAEIQEEIREKWSDIKHGKGNLGWLSIDIQRLRKSQKAFLVGSPAHAAIEKDIQRIQSEADEIGRVRSELEEQIDCLTVELERLWPKD